MDITLSLRSEDVQGVELDDNTVLEGMSKEEYDDHLTAEKKARERGKKG